ncbi:DUF6809 family protein [Clostridium sp. AN503]|uniref:DUF6809 family protein n=1 Tax=Clostridium sp. AN503 TaxID=3160598 RepID=UPI00345B490D
MQEILKQLYNGEISPAEQYLPFMEEYKKLWKEQYQHYEDFVQELNKLSTPLGDRFIKIMNEQLETIPLELSEMFIDGFRLGVKMMIEVFEDK